MLFKRSHKKDDAAEKQQTEAAPATAPAPAASNGNGVPAAEAAQAAAPPPPEKDAPAANGDAAGAAAGSSSSAAAGAGAGTGTGSSSLLGKKSSLSSKQAPPAPRNTRRVSQENAAAAEGPKYSKKELKMMHDKDPLSGRPGHLDPGQEHQLRKFRAAIEERGIYNPERHDDACMCRFLRARKWDLDASLAMFEEAERWRKEFKVDELYDNFEYPEKEEVDKYYPQYYHKTDKDGRPVYIEQLGKLDIKALYAVTTPERQIQKLVVEYEKFQRERLPVCSAETGHLVETSCTIMDLKSVGVSQFWKVSSYVQQASNIGQHYYPETMGKFYIVNAPYIFTTVWSVVKGWLDPVTVEKIKILGSGYEKELAAQIPIENLPPNLGGKCTCEGGCSLSDAGPWNTQEGKAIIEKVREEEAAKKVQHEKARSGGGAEQPAAAAAPAAEAPAA